MNDTTSLSLLFFYIKYVIDSVVAICQIDDRKKKRYCLTLGFCKSHNNQMIYKE